MSSCHSSALAGAGIGVVPVSIDVPGVVAVDREGLPLILLNRRSSHPTGAVLPRPWVHPRLANEGLDRGSGFVIDGPGVIRQWLTARPIGILRDILAYLTGIAGAGKRDAFQFVDAHGFGCSLQNRPGIDVTRGEVLANCKSACDGQRGKENP